MVAPDALSPATAASVSGGALPLPAAGGQSGGAGATQPGSESVATYATATDIAELTHAGLGPLSACGSIAHLREFAGLLEEFSVEESDLLASAMLLVRAQPGQVLIAEGTMGDWMLLVLAGTIDVTKRRTVASEAGASASANPAVGSSSGAELPSNVSRLAVIRPGTLLGEMSMLDGEPRYATCTAIDQVEAGVLTRAGIARLIRLHPAVGAKLLVKITQLLAQRLRNTSNQMMRLVNAK